jgi:ParB-like chromosome segregation protein Spo0J
MPQKARGPVKLSFERKTLRIAVEDIAPLHQITPAVKKGIKYRQICSSIKEVGIIEPPVVMRSGQRSKYIMLDGHLRLEACKDQGLSHLVCLIATDDEAFTYNRHISRLASVQEHKMIMLAIERGVPEKTIAKALDIKLGTLRQKCCRGYAPRWSSS